MRFRRYLGNPYQDDKNTYRDAEGTRHALPLLSVYFLGHTLEGVRVPVLKVKRDDYDAETGERIDARDRFVESLTHDSVVVQIPYLTGWRRTELGRLLSIFDPAQQDPKDKHYLLVDQEAYPVESVRIIWRLASATLSEEVHETVRIEDEVLNELQKLERLAAEKAEEAEEARKRARAKGREAAIAALVKMGMPREEAEQWIDRPDEAGA